MKTTYRVLIVVACALWVSISLVHSTCDVCQSNNVACINETAFYRCQDSEPLTKQAFDCPEGLVCTDLPLICFQRSERPASCGDTDTCGLCNSNQVFACTSRTSFALCFGSLQPTKVNGTCPDDKKYCDASSSKICVPEISSDSIICNLE